MFTSAELIDDQQLIAFQDAIGQSVIGIVGKDDYGNFGRQIGTGTLIEVDGNRSILTAKHVIRGCSANELEFLLPAEGMRMRKYSDPLNLELGEVIKRERLSIQGIRQDARLDVALLELGAASIPSYWNSRRLTKLASSVPTGTHAVMMGFRAQRAVSYVDGNLIAIKNFDFPEVKDRGLLTLEKFDPSLHFLVDFPSAAEFHPGGYSGGGIWFKASCHEPKADELWYSDPVYAGMVLSYYDRLQLLKILKVDVIIDFLHRP